jgi:hypothetical protein
MLLAALGSLSLPFWLVAVAAVVLVVLVVKAAYRTDDRIERRREEAIDLSNVAVSEGFPLLAQIAKLYAVGDYDGVAHAIKHFIEVMRDPDQRNAALAAMNRIQIAKQLKDPGSRENLFVLLEKELGYPLPRTKPEEPATPAAAVTVTAATK